MTGDLSNQVNAKPPATEAMTMVDASPTCSADHPPSSGGGRVDQERNLTSATPPRSVARER